MPSSSAEAVNPINRWSLYGECWASSQIKSNLPPFQAAPSWSLFQLMSARMATSSSPAAMRARRLLWLVTSGREYILPPARRWCLASPGGGGDRNLRQLEQDCHRLLWRGVVQVVTSVELEEA